MKRIKIFIITAILVFIPVMCYATSPAIETYVDVPDKITVSIDRETDDLELVSIEETRTVISADDATGLKAIMLDLIGDYETVITDYTYQSGSSGYYSHSISIERDYAWIWSCVVFIVVVYCTFRGIGGLIKK